MVATRCHSPGKKYLLPPPTFYFLFALSFFFLSFPFLSCCFLLLYPLYSFLSYFLFFASIISPLYYNYFLPPTPPTSTARHSVAQQWAAHTHMLRLILSHPPSVANQAITYHQSSQLFRKTIPAHISPPGGSGGTLASVSRTTTEIATTDFKSTPTVVTTVPSTRSESDTKLTRYSSSCALSRNIISPSSSSSSTIKYI